MIQPLGLLLDWSARQQLCNCAPGAPCPMDYPYVKAVKAHKPHMWAWVETCSGERLAHIIVSPVGIQVIRSLPVDAAAWEAIPVVEL